MKHIPTKRIAWLCLSLVIAIAVLWAARKPLHGRYNREKSAFLSFAARTLIGTRFSDSAWAHWLLSDYANLHRYQAANRTLPPATAGRIVFYGDSITVRWVADYPAEFFPGKPYIGRGISGQSTAELYWRFRQDAIDLHPSAVVILAGTNDVVLSQRHIDFQQTTTNIQAMAQAASQHGIRVILCSIPPVAHYPPPDEAAFTANIQALNAWLRTYTAQHHLTYIDYFTAMSTHTGELNPSLSDDSLHPNAAGYALMQRLAQQALNSQTNH